MPKDEVDHQQTLDTDNERLKKSATKESSKGSSKNDETPYSRFGTREKYLMVLICASSGIFSTIAGPIYFPALTTIENDFHITTELVNVSVVLYFVFQGLAPTLMGGLADTFGRRPVVLWSIMLYFVACIGLACCKEYGEILFLRCVQSAGISPVIAVNSGIMGDITTREQRGGYVGLTAGFQIVGSAFGALIGGGIVSRWDWRAIFWFLAIGSGVSLLFTSMVLPETKRTIVGNGSITPKSIWSRAPILALPTWKRKLHLNNPDYETLIPKEKLNLLAPIGLFRRPEIAFLLLTTGLQFSLWVCHLTALASLLEKDYHLTVAKVGICYLPSGICTLISVVSAGRVLNWNYRRRYSKHKRFIEQAREELLAEYDHDEKRVDAILTQDLAYAFNIFRARLEIIFIPLLLSGAGFIIFGWCLGQHESLALVLFFSGFASLFSNCVIACATTLVVDLYPQKSSTATGCVNFSRCIMAAIFVAALNSMMSSMTVGGTFTLMAGLTMLSTTTLVIPIKYGLQLMHKRELKALAESENVPEIDPECHRGGGGDTEHEELEEHLYQPEANAGSDTSSRGIEIIRRMSTAHSTAAATT
ncbi:LANO_0H07624g1_1 [Lachancea nothofagi CBS 11611]|uniref:LANO_0H07624g1_1 n=1 Tax=Lachancea nothofagi CBS 11611 TaxID=1266666 RepID=A0A1G4KM11_9SACH|nr:LANO_0H07624g1_1 [Lachancea nothofagi CBS 11611]